MKLHINKFLKEKGITKEQFKANPNMEVPPLKIKTGLFSSKVITLDEINK